MSAGCLTLGRSLLNKANFLAEAGEAQQLTVIDDPRVVAAENGVYESLAAQATPFITTLDEATVHVGAIPQSPCLAGAAAAAAGSSSACRGAGSSSYRGPPYVRLRAVADPAAAASTTWRERKAAFDEARRVENRVERLVCDADAAAAERRILQRLATSRLEVATPKAKCGSNAQFEAISVALWGTPMYHPLLRQLAVALMRAHPEEYVVFLGADFEPYLRAMSRSGVSGDELTLRAVADHFGVVINLITADNFMWFLRYAPRQTLSQREVFLAHIAPYIYLPVRRRSPMTMLRLNLNWSGEKLARQAHMAAAQQQEQQQQQQQGLQLGPPTPEQARGFSTVL